MEKFDVIVIGGGPAGYPAAIRAAQLGRQTALIEREALGGTCLNWGCIPTKTLIAGAARVHDLKQGDVFGLTAEGISVDYAAMIGRKNDVVGKLQSGIAGLLKAHGVKVINGEARFEAPRRISVTAAGGNRRWLEGRAVIIASGSTPAHPGFIPDHPRIYDSRRFLDRDKLPESLLVLGGGVIGCEFACMAAQLGVKVTIVELLDDVLMMLDPDVRREVRRYMEQQLAITVLTGAGAESIQANRTGVSAKRDGQTLHAEIMLVAVGRRPDTAALELHRAGIEPQAQGAIPVDAEMRTVAPGVFAAGDATVGSTQLAHAATAQGLTAAANAAGGRRPAEVLVPSCIFTTPEVGAVGLTETGAAETNRAVKTGRFAFAALGKALAAGHPEGFVKWIADAKTGRLLGAHAVGAHATELIAEASLAIRNELTAEELAHTVHCHPTLSEAWMEAAHALHGDCVHQPPPRRR